MGLSERDREIYKSNGSNTDVCNGRLLLCRRERDSNAGLFMTERVAVARAWLGKQPHFQ
jgi:hypothetical protein